MSIVRHLTGWTMDNFWRDTRYGWRALRREPTFAFTAIVTLALGVATATTIFSVVDAELWRPLPYRDADRLMAVSSAGPGGRTESVSGADLTAWTTESRAFDSLAGTTESRRRVLQGQTAQSLIASTVTWNYFATLGRDPLLGRTFSAVDGREGAAVLTDRAWRRLFDADPAIVGRPVTVDGQLLRVVGIVAADDSLGPEAELFLPVDPSAAEFLDPAAKTVSTVIGRLHTGWEPAGAQAELQTIAGRLAGQFPEGRTGRVVRVSDLQAHYTGYNWRPLYFLLGGSALVLVLTCVNVAGLFVARALRRRREFAVRSALGGGTRTLVSQLATEGVLVALPAGVIALFLTHWALGFLATQVPPGYLVRGTTIPLDARAGLFALIVVGFTAVLFAIVPVLTARRTDINLTLGDGGRTAGSAPAQTVTRRILLTVEIALTLVLVAGGGLFFKSYAALLQVPLGFEAGDRIAVRLTLSGPRYATDDQIQGYMRVLLERARGVAGVTGAAVASSSPLTSGPIVRFTAGGRPAPAAGEEPRAILRATTPDFFRVLGIRLLQGRELSDNDTAGGPRVAVVNEVLARRLFPGQDPVGQTLTLVPGARAPWTRRPGAVTIVGVTANVKEVGINEVEFNDIYVPYAQMPAPAVELIVRAGVPAAGLVSMLRGTVAAIDANLPVGSVTPLQTRVAEALRQDRFHLLLIGSFAIVALVLAAIGIYGAVAYGVQQRRREFGVRLALGARPRRIVLVALRESLRLGVWGGAIGLGFSLVIAKVLGNALYLVPGEHNGLLFGVRTTDPTVLAVAWAGMVVLALLAGAIPARAVARLDPVTALRHD